MKPVEVVAVRAAALRGVVAAVVLVLAGAGTGVAGAAGGPVGEADLAYHGRVALSDGRLGVWLVPQNDGPAALEAATLRIRLSSDLAPRQALAEGCARAGVREVVCETGPVPAHGQGRHIGLALGLAGRPAEVLVRVDTWWNGGTSERGAADGEQVVLALDTGDAYAF
ncbi:hypothetical protein [Streptomyces antimicrobicus]|uniref:Uncharacterized protein n=1 Tax=Streptomyces antimicrobicus TaxID=2883108 RepID=A0ABS8B2X5_9ACTN|nr:hypothetical protein [Streptomyces antimicrobicus]MCB5178964.1 hypothetical protein [Streptomyces antimicrobicus]